MCLQYLIEMYEICPTYFFFRFIFHIFCMCERGYGKKRTHGHINQMIQHISWKVPKKWDTICIIFLNKCNRKSLFFCFMKNEFRWFFLKMCKYRKIRIPFLCFRSIYHSMFQLTSQTFTQKKKILTLILND